MKHPPHMPLESHPFGSFLPADTRFLIVGTFPGRIYSQRSPEQNAQDPQAFSYAGRNQFWKILSQMYDKPLPDKYAKMQLLTDLQMGMIDMIAACRRRKNSNLDSDLYDIVWNTHALQEALTQFAIDKVYVTGKGAAQMFAKLLPQQPHIVLPSPSPAYASMRFSEKLAFYQTVLPTSPFAKPDNSLHKA